MTENRYAAQDAVDFATALLSAAGLPADRARVVADILVEGDLMGHTTHGLQLLGPYLGSLESGGMTKEGDPEVISDRPAAVCWNGRKLPGPWLVVQAIALAEERARQLGSCTVAIHRSHHIACLAAFLREPAERGMMVEIASSDPASGSVAPYGGTRAVMTPNPFAAGWPTAHDPIMIDVSMSITTNGMSNRLAREGKTFDHKWLKDPDGVPTDDPAVFSADPPGTIQPMGGMDHGHKGYALGLWVEAMTSGLAGMGRAVGSSSWGAAVLVRVTDPDAFAGLDAFRSETGWMAEACRDNPVPAGAPAVRLPGWRGLALRREQLEKGVLFHPGIWDSLLPWADKMGVAAPSAISNG